MKKDADKEIKVPAPPTILFVLPNGVSMASKATLPTVTRRIINYFGLQRYGIRFEKYSIDVIITHRYWWDFVDGEKVQSINKAFSVI
jgi:hypothetical protein